MKNKSSVSVSLILLFLGTCLCSIIHVSGAIDWFRPSLALSKMKSEHDSYGKFIFSNDSSIHISKSKNNWSLEKANTSIQKDKKSINSFFGDSSSTSNRPVEFFEGSEDNFQSHKEK